MLGHLQVVVVQGNGCVALANMCYGADAAALVRKQRAVWAGGRGVAVAALQEHPGNAGVQRFGQLVIDHILA